MRRGLSGINTRLLTVKIFTLMGFLCAIAGLVAQARRCKAGNDLEATSGKNCG